MAVTRLPLVSQPQGPVDVEWLNPISRGLVALPLLSLGGYDPVRNFVPAVDLAVTKTAGRYGRVMRGTTTAAGLRLTAGTGLSSLVPTNSPFTVMVLLRVATTGSRRIIFADFDAAGANESICLEQRSTNDWRFYTVDTGPAAQQFVGGTVTVGWHWVEFGWDGTNLQTRIDGTSFGPVGSLNPRRAGTDLRALRGGAFTSLGFDGDIAFLGIWKRYVPTNERDSIRANPWQLYQPTKRNAVFGVGGGATNYTLTASAGSYSLTGIDATLTYTPAAVNYSLTADVGAYALSGVDATLTYTVAGTAYTLSADAGAYSLTGVDATLSYVPGSGAYTLTADTGSYTLNGNDAGLTFARRMAVDVGSYTLAGVDAGLQLGRRLTADTGSYALAGVDADLIYTALGPTAYTLTAETGSYLLTGSPAGLTYGDGSAVIDTHDGFWAREWARIRAREKRKHNEEIEERVEEIQDEIAEVEQQITEVKQAPKPKQSTPARDFYAEQARIVEHLIARRNELIEEEDEELLLLL